MSATALVTTGLKILFARARPEWQDSVDLLTTQVVPVRPRLVDGGVRGDPRGADVGVRTPQLDASRRCSLGWWSGRGWSSASTGCCWAATTRPTSSPARCWASAIVLLGCRADRPRAARPRGEGGAAAGGLRDRAAARRHRQPGQGRGRRPVPGDRLGHGHRVRLVAADLALHDRRGPRHRHGRGRLGRRRRPGARVRRRRHGARGVRRAGRHRHPGRDRPGRHRQPAGAQPRHPALPAVRDRRRPQRPGPRHRPGPRSAATASRPTPTSW